MIYKTTGRHDLLIPFLPDWAKRLGGGMENKNNNNKMRLIIAGSRTFKDYKLLKKTLDEMIVDYPDTVQVVSGTAKGADKLGEQWAKEYGFSVKQFPAEWSKYGMSAGFIRNKQMAEYGTHCVVFWDGESSGSEMMIELAQKNRLPTKIILYKQQPNEP